MQIEKWFWNKLYHVWTFGDLSTQRFAVNLSYNFACFLPPCWLFGITLVAPSQHFKSLYSPCCVCNTRILRQFSVYILLGCWPWSAWCPGRRGGLSWSGASQTGRLTIHIISGIILHTYLHCLLCVSYILYAYMTKGKLFQYLKGVSILSCYRIIHKCSDFAENI